MKFTLQQLLLALIVFSSLFTKAQNVGIGTTKPPFKLTVQTPTGYWGFMHTDSIVYIGSYIGGGIAEFGTRSNHPFYLFANNSDNPPAITIDKAGVNVGIGNTAPVYTLDVHSGGNAQFNLKEGTGGQTALFSRYTNRLEIQPSDAFEISVGGVDQRNLYVSNTAVGMGMVPTSTTIRLQMQAPVNGNGIYISGASTRTALDAQTGDLTLENGNAYLYNGSMGINTSSPEAPLDVENGNGSLGPYGYAYFDVGDGQSGPSFSTGAGNGTINNLAIIAGGNIAGLNIYAFSDARIKDIKGVTSNENDLATLNAIQVTDYTMKDKVMNGNKQFKKVIAQQVETVYPQVVSKHTDFIPNVYQLTDKIEKTPDGYLLTFKNKHHIDGSAKKLQLIMMNGEKQLHDIVAIPSDYQVLIHSENITDKEVFVYGEQVNDFRTVDYDGLTTLNISATQELSKLVKKQQEEIDELISEVKELKEKH